MTDPERDGADSSDRADRAGRRSVIAFLVATAAAVGLAVVYWQGGQPQFEGALLAVAFAGLGYGLVRWANDLLPQGPYEEPRHRLTASSRERRQLAADAERVEAVTRRRLLAGSLGLGLAAVGGALLFPFRSLGPSPGRALLTTVWTRGKRAVTADGRPVRADEVPVNGLVTAFPQGEPGSADGQIVLMRVDPSKIRPLPGRESWTPDGLIAYSKVCTHAGCPVGLYEAETHELLCPCHQSSFDVLRGARPTAGPAAWPLPQLPLAIDAEGIVVSQGDFSGPVGPGWWREP
jgi:ubiquinol-cytochrome c reductase iron-sulfur subunit